MRTRVVMLGWGWLVLSVLPLAAQPPVPRPGPEHEKLKKLVGDWDATVTSGGMESKATSQSRIDLGGLWLLTVFHADFGGTKFEGMGAMGYDPLKKKYVSAWIDSMSPSLLVMEGNFDKEGKTYTETGEGKAPDGKPAKLKAVYQFPDKDTIHFTLSSVGNGKDQEMLKITYRRKR